MGGGKDSLFFSGAGSHDNDIIEPYKNLLINILKNQNISRIVEIGCGDFHIMSDVLVHCPIKYIGLDIVSDLIEHNKQQFQSERIEFRCMDASQPDVVLPVGDLLIIRQVLQHLTNADISEILCKSRSYPYVLITEHLYEGEGSIPNMDKAHGAGIRTIQKSGVFVELPPFSSNHYVHLLRVPQCDGNIRTTLIINDVEKLIGGRNL